MEKAMAVNKGNVPAAMKDERFNPNPSECIRGKNCQWNKFLLTCHSAFIFSLSDVYDTYD